jgi:penicillin amidase
MKIIRRLLYLIIVFVLTGIVVVLIYLSSQKPHYDGSMELDGLNNTVEVIYDFYGIPHIYATTEEDAYFALGYVHAQDRLFQMEMTRRVASGRLAEILGKDFIKVDAFFKTLGLAEHAEAASRIYLTGNTENYQKAAKSYLKGINVFIKEGITPVEFVMLGIDKEEYTIKDLYLSSEFMAFNFAMGFRTDPLMSFIRKNLGKTYYADIFTSYRTGTERIPVNDDSTYFEPEATALIKTFMTTPGSVTEVLNKIPIPPITGSNGWLLSPSRSSSGKVLFGNDTHIGFGQPAVWYEAHMEYPGFSFYGNYLAGLPFAAIGHTKEKTWGLTMLENDDLDFYQERVKPGDSTLYWANGKWNKFSEAKKVIKVKGEEDVVLTVMESRHGPVVSQVMPEWKQVTGDAVAMYWTHLKFSNNLLQVTYQLNHANDIDEFRDAVSQIISPGLNVMYGDKAGNIAWWAAGKLMKRAKGVDPVVLIDGSDFKLDPPGFYDFKDNPQLENPSSGFLYSANNQPDSMSGVGFYPGYYVPEDRALRIKALFDEKEKYSTIDLQQISNDVLSPVTPVIARAILEAIRVDVKQKSPAHANVANLLSAWDGNHHLRDRAPVVYYKLLYHILRLSMQDELGEENFKVFLSTHVMKNSVLPFIQNDSSVWWNDVNSRDVVESRNMILEKAFDQTISELKEQLGSNQDMWDWGRVHVLEHKHPIGMKKPFDVFFNVGPYPVAGGPEVINQMGFDLNGEGVYRVKYGPAMRIVMDMADPENSRSILPTGQSGNVMSRYYYDQAMMYNTGKFRRQKMNRPLIESNRSGYLTLYPVKKK